MTKIKIAGTDHTVDVYVRGHFINLTIRPDDRDAPCASAVLMRHDVEAITKAMDSEQASVDMLRAKTLPSDDADELLASGEPDDPALPAPADNYPPDATDEHFGCTTEMV